VDYCVFDAAVNSGPGRAAKWLQSCVGVEPDGGIGPKTLAAVAAFDPKELVDDYAKRRLSFLSDLPTWGTFGKGWSRRVAEVRTAATTMTA
jgi:lysozyme family protein